MLLGQREYDECIPILEAFALTRSGQLQTDREQKAIAELTGISKGRVSQIIKQAKKDGLISSKGELTQSGFMEL